MNHRIKGMLLTLWGGICWGLSGSVGQYLFTKENMDSRWLVPIRLGIAGVLLLIYCARRYGKLVLAPWTNRQDARDLVLYGLAGVSACQFLYFLTIQLSTAGMATILQDLSPILILLYTCFTAKRLPRANEILSIALALLGVFLLTTHGSLTELMLPLSALITGCLSAVCVTIYNVTPQNLMRRYPVLLMQGWAFIMGSIVIGCIFRPWTYHYIPTATGCLGIAFVVLIGNVMAFPCYIEGVRLIGPDKGILYGFSEPITAAVISTFVLGSSFTLYDAAGFLCIFIMLVLISVGSRKQP